MEGGGEEGEGRVKVLWGTKVRSIQPLRMAGCLGGGGGREGRENVRYN